MSHNQVLDAVIFFGVSFVLVTIFQIRFCLSYDFSQGVEPSHCDLGLYRRESRQGVIVHLLAIAQSTVSTAIRRLSKLRHELHVQNREKLHRQWSRSDPENHRKANNSKFESLHEKNRPLYQCPSNVDASNSRKETWIEALEVPFRACC